MKRDVMSRIVLNVTEPADLVFAIAVADAYRPTAETISAVVDGLTVPITEVSDAHGTRLHRIQAPVGQLLVQYDAAIDGQGETLGATDTDLLVYTRPSRYAESDALAPTANAEFRGVQAADMLAGVSSWVGTELVYISGSSLPTDGAVQTLLNRRGVCRDFAHLCVALLRAEGIPARLVAVYAPGLQPMDFHAVAEAWVDATTLAPRETLVRIATGRDAADTAFLNVMSGRADLVEVSVGAVADVLPDDDITRLVQIA